MSSRLTNFFGCVGCLFIPIGIALLIILVMMDQFAIGIVLFIVLLIIAIAFMARAGEMEKANKEKFKNYIASFKPQRKSFTETDFVAPDSLLTRIAVDEQEKMVYIWQPRDLKKPIREMTYDVFEYPFIEITEVQIMINGQITRKAEPEKINSLKLVVYVPDEIHTLIFFDPAIEKSRTQLMHGTLPYQERLKSLKTAYALLNNVKQQTTDSPNDEEAFASNNNEPKEELLEATEENIVYLEEDAHAHFDEAFDKIKASQEVELDSSPAVEEEQRNDTIEPEESQFITNDEDDFYSRYNETPLETSQEADSLSDFEKFLESNKQKQYGDREKE